MGRSPQVINTETSEKKLLFCEMWFPTDDGVFLSFIKGRVCSGAKQMFSVSHIGACDKGIWYVALNVSPAVQIQELDGSCRSGTFVCW